MTCAICTSERIAKETLDFPESDRLCNYHFEFCGRPCQPLSPLAATVLRNAWPEILHELALGNVRDVIRNSGEWDLAETLRARHIQTHEARDLRKAMGER